MELLAKLRCPDCSRPLEPRESHLVCECGGRFPIVRGVPFLFETGVLESFAKADSGRAAAAGEDAYSKGGAYHWKAFRVEDLLPDPAAGPEALVVGCGDGYDVAALRRLGFRPVGMDVRRSPGTDFLADGQNLPLADSCFDIVLSTQVLEHVQRPWRAVEEVARVLRPGGCAVGSVAFQKGFHGSYFHISHLGMAWMAEEAGLTVEHLGAAQSPTYSLLGGLLPIGPRWLRRWIWGIFDRAIYGARALAYRLARGIDPHEPTDRFRSPVPLSFAAHDRLRDAPAVVFKLRKPS